MYILKFSPEFGEWLSTLRDIKAKVKIITRLERAAKGNFGDVKPLGGGLFEMRENYGLDTAFIIPGKGKSSSCC